MLQRAFEIRAEWDQEASVWIATSEDVPGLCCEAATFEALVDVVLELVPDLLIANHAIAPDQAADIPVRLVAEREAVAHRVA